jgi:hypothetical protein
MNLNSLTRRFPTEKDAPDHPARTFWPKGVRCLVCNHGKCWQIDGYMNGSDMAERLTRSHSRALILRSYLETHFQLPPGNLGAVPLNNTPFSF